MIDFIRKLWWSVFGKPARKKKGSKPAGKKPTFKQQVGKKKRGYIKSANHKSKPRNSSKKVKQSSLGKDPRCVIEYFQRKSQENYVAKDLQCLVEQALREIEITGFPRSKGRKKVMKKGEKSIESFTVGLSQKYGASYGAEAQYTSTYPKLTEVLLEFLHAHEGYDSTTDYCTSITVNRNCEMPIHKDPGNWQTSVITALGGYEGGEFRIKSNSFDGGYPSKESRRFSIVYYVHSMWNKCDDSLKKRLEQFGFSFPQVDDSEIELG